MNIQHLSDTQLDHDIAELRLSIADSQFKNPMRAKQLKALMAELTRRVTAELAQYTAPTITSRYISDDEINELAGYGFTTYEVCACWARAKQAIRDYALDEWSVRLTVPQYMLAVKLARIQWQSACDQVSRLNGAA